MTAPDELVDARPAVLVTGAARGIGAATARRFAAAGRRVGAYDVHGEGAAAVAAERAARRPVASSTSTSGSGCRRRLWRRR